MSKKIKEQQKELTLLSESEGKKPKLRTNQYLNSLNSWELEKLIRSYEGGVIPPEVVQVLSNSKDPKIRRLMLSTFSDNPEKNKKIEVSILNGIVDADEGIRSLALDMSLSMNIWIKDLKNNRSSFTQKICMQALNDSSDQIRSKAAFYTLKLPKQWQDEVSSAVLAGLPKTLI